MVARRIVPAFLLALAIASLMTWVLSRRMLRPVAAASVPIAHLMAPSHAMNVGDMLDTPALQWVDWPANAVPSGSFKRPADLQGRVLLVPLAAGQPILTPYLAALGTGSGLLAKIPAGMRAVSVQADEITGVSGFVTPDSFVDVLVTARVIGDGPVAIACVLQDVRVLAVGSKAELGPAAPGPRAPTSAAQSLTLLLSNQDAMKLAQAVAQGKVQFLLRNGADRGVVALTALETRPPTLAVRPAQAPVARKPEPHAPQTDPYGVETVSGGKQPADSLDGKAR